jgi:hypothetical protein
MLDRITRAAAREDTRMTDPTKRTWWKPQLH